MPFRRRKAKIRRHGDAQAREIDGGGNQKIAAVANVLAVDRRRQRVDSIIANHGGEQQAEIRHCTRHRPEHAERVPAERSLVARHHPRRGAKPDDAVVGGRVAQRPSGIRAGCDWHHTRRQHDARPAGRASRGFVGRKGIAGHAIDGVAGVGAGTPFRRIRLANDDRTGLADRSDDPLVLLRHVILKQYAAVGRAQACGILKILDPDRQAMQRPERVPAHHRSLGLARRDSRTLEIARHHRVDCRIDGLDAPDATLQKLDRRQPFGTDQMPGVRGVEITGLHQRLRTPHGPAGPPIAASSMPSMASGTAERKGKAAGISGLAGGTLLLVKAGRSRLSKRRFRHYRRHQ